MQRIFKAECTAEEYSRQGKSFSFPDLTGELCPHCGSDFLVRHGFYKRYLILLHFSGILLIRRYLCKGCGRTISLLPSFAHPGRAYGVEPIVHALSMFYTAGKRVCEIAASHICSRQQLRWFRKRIEQNLNMLVMGLTEMLDLRAPPVTDPPIEKRAGQFFECIRSFAAEDISLKMFERTRKTYLTPLPG
jgi:transposase-like protein